MTNLSYNICLHGHKVTNTKSYQEALSMVSKLGRGWNFEPVYNTFNPDDTPKHRESCKEHAKKFAEALKKKRTKKVSAS